MKFQLKKVKGSAYCLKAEIDEKTVAERTHQIVQKFQKESHLKGFRPGKAPVDLIEKTYEKEIDHEVMETLVGETLWACLQEARLDPVGPPRITELKKTEGKRISFQAEFESIPEFKLAPYKGIPVSAHPVTTGEEDLDRALQALQESKAELEPVVLIRPIQEGDWVRCDLEVFENGSVGSKQEGVMIPMERKRDLAPWVDALLGAQVGDQREIWIPVAPSAREESGLLDQKKRCRIWIREIKTKKCLPLDDDFASLFGQPNLQALKKGLRKELESLTILESQKAQRREILDYLLAHHDFDLPEGMVRDQTDWNLRRTRASREGKSGAADEGNALPESSEEEKAQAMEQARREVRLYFILKRIAKAEHAALEPTEEEVETEIRLWASRSRISESEARQRFREDILLILRQEKILNFLLAHAQIIQPNKEVRE